MNCRRRTGTTTPRARRAEPKVEASAALEVVAPGAFASVQDRGRRGWRRAGVPWAGVLDPRLMRLANALVGNDAEAPVIEAFDGGLHLRARGAPVRVAVAGDAELQWTHDGTVRAVDAWRSITLADDDALRVRRLRRGRLVVVAVEGLALPAVLGSASTYARAGLGGLDGRALTPGTRLPTAPARAMAEQTLPEPPRRDDRPLRAVPGPQHDHFSADTLDGFAAGAWTVGAEADRMGVRLQGVPLVHAGAKEIVSDATVPGSIQVPGNGQPIVLLADAQTAGGYPKIGTVVGADLARVADARPGDVLRFAWVSTAEAEALARSAEAATVALVASLRPLPPDGVDLRALYAANLIDGVVDALSSEHRPLGPLDAAPA
jgi:biotin-dependent carboxylase-like uncharacterized protein